MLASLTLRSGASWKDAVSDGFGSTNANNGGDDYNGSGTSYTRPNIDVGGTFSANGNDMNLEGAINAGNINIDLIGDLNITTVLDTYKGDGDSLNFGGGKNSINIGFGDKDDDKAWANEDQIAGLYTDGTADINVDGTTSLTGGAIVADELNLTTGDLEINDLDIYDKSKDKEIAIGVNLNNFDSDDKNDSNSYGNVDYKNEGHDKEGEINSTIASNGGTITIGGKETSQEELEELGVNTNLDNLHVITKDENWSTDLSLELINAGVAADQVKDVTNAIKSITAKVPEQVKAQGPNAENLYRKGIANGKSEEEALAYMQSDTAQQFVDWRNDLDKKIETAGGLNEMGSLEVYALLQQEMVSLADKIIIKNCASSSQIEVCANLAKAMNMEYGDLSSEKLTELINSFDATMDGRDFDPSRMAQTEALKKLAVACAALWAQETGDTSSIKNLDEETKKGFQQDLANAGIDPVAYGYRMQVIDIMNDDSLSLEEKRQKLYEITGKIDGLQQSDAYPRGDKDLKEVKEFTQGLDDLLFKHQKGDFAGGVPECKGSSCDKYPSWLKDNGYPYILGQNKFSMGNHEHAILNDDGGLPFWERFPSAIQSGTNASVAGVWDIGRGKISPKEVGEGLAYLAANPGLIDDVILADVYKEAKQGDLASAAGYTVELVGLGAVGKELAKLSAQGVKITPEIAKGIKNKVFDKVVKEQELINDAWSWTDNSAGKGDSFAGADFGNWSRFDVKVDKELVIKQVDNSSCGQACGAMVLRDRGVDVKPTDIGEGLSSFNINHSVKSEKLLEQVKNASPSNVEWFGGHVGIGKEAEDALNILTRPNGGSWIAELKDSGSKIGHAVVVDGVDKAGNIIIRDPWDQTIYNMSKKDFMDNWTGGFIGQ